MCFLRISSHATAKFCRSGQEVDSNFLLASAATPISFTSKMVEEKPDDVWQPTSSQIDPFLYMKPHSEKADEKGISVGNLIMESLQQAESLKKKRDYLRKKCRDIPVEVTQFKNWGKTQESLLLYAKPTCRKEIMRLVKAASEYNDEFKDDEPIKVNIYMWQSRVENEHYSGS